MSGGGATMATLHSRLLELHRLLLEAVRLDYERTHGRVESPGQLLQLVIGDEAFAWLHPLSELLVQLDDPEVVPDAATARARVEALLAGGTAFHAPYVEALQSVPAVVLAHADVMRALEALPATKPPAPPRVSA